MLRRGRRPLRGGQAQAEAALAALSRARAAKRTGAASKGVQTAIRSQKQTRSGRRRDLPTALLAVGLRAFQPDRGLQN